jgi:hypothetical protein
VEDGKENTGSNKGNHNRPDQAIGGPKANEASQETANESSYNADNNVADQPIASPTHHPAREKASHQPNNQPCQKPSWLKIGSVDKCCKCHDFVLSLIGMYRSPIFLPLYWAWEESHTLFLSVATERYKKRYTSVK